MPFDPKEQLTLEIAKTILPVLVAKAPAKTVSGDDRKRGEQPAAVACGAFDYADAFVKEACLRGLL